MVSCIVTQISIIPDQIESLATFKGYSALSQKKYHFNDTVSFAETLSTDLADFCGEKILSFTLDGSETNLINYTTEGNIQITAPKNTQKNGFFKASVFASMKNYPNIQSVPIEFNVAILQSDVPQISD